MSSWRQQTLIEAPVAEVWELLCDPSRAPEWGSDVIAVTGAPVRIENGSTFDVTGRWPLGMKGTTSFKVDRFEDMHELRMQCQVSGFYSHWTLTDAQGGTFTEVELGVEAIGGVPSRAAVLIHSKRYLRHAVEDLLDGLRDALSSEVPSRR